MSVLDRVYEEGKAETLAHPFVKDEQIFTREDKSYKEAKRILNELVKHSKSHHRSVVKNCILMCVILTLLLIEIMLKRLVYPLIYQPDYLAIELSFPFEIPLSFSLVVLISVTTCFDVPCCWRFGFKKAKFSMARNLHNFKLVLLVLYLVILLIKIIATFYVTNLPKEYVCLSYDFNQYFSNTTFCSLRTTTDLSKHTSFMLYNFILSMVILILVLFVLLYVFIMLFIITVKWCCYKNSFRPVHSFRNLLHEIVMIDIFDDSNKIYQSRLIENVIEII